MDARLPRRWRETRGDELMGVLQDLAGPDADRLGARRAFDLVRGGWATRWREHPPLGRWLGYRLLELELPQHRAWVRDDVEGPLYGLRALMLVQIPLGVLLWSSGDVPMWWLWLRPAGVVGRRVRRLACGGGHRRLAGRVPR